MLRCFRKREEKERRDREYLRGDDISICQRCGDYTHIWHIWDKEGEVIGSYCTRCFWTCGEATILDVLQSKMWMARRRIVIIWNRRRRKRWK